MKTPILLGLFAFSGFISAQPSRTYTTQAARKAFYDKLLQQHADPATREIFAKAKPGFFDQYVDGNTEQDLLDSYGTVIHELLHSYNTGTATSDHSIFLEPGNRILFDYGKYYNAKELNVWVSKGAQDSILRYGLYVAGKSDIMGKEVDLNRGEGSEVMSVVMGVYGLVEEFDAYYHGLKAKSTLEGHYSTTSGYDPAEWKSHLAGQLQQSMVPYYEFRLFIAWYLKYAQLKHPDIYQDIMANQQLRKAYTEIDKRFSALVAAVAEQVERLNEGGNALETMSGLDFKGSEDDFYRFCELAGIDREYLYKEEVVMENGKKVLRKKALLGPAEMKELRDAYDAMARQIQEAGMGESIGQLMNVPAQIEYLNRLLTSDLRKVLANFRLQD